MKDTETVIRELEQKVQAAEEARLRAIADCKNLERQVAQERQSLYLRVTTEILSDLLPTLDHLELALTHFADHSLKMIVSQLHKTLEMHGLKRIEALHQPFNEQTMEAIEQVPGPAGQVMVVQQPGYALGEKIIRYAKVSVGDGTETEK